MRLKIISDYVNNSIIRYKNVESQFAFFCMNSKDSAYYFSAI